MATAAPRQPDLPVEGKTVRAMVSLLAKRGHADFQAGALNQEDEAAYVRSTCAQRAAAASIKQQHCGSICSTVAEASGCGLLYRR